MDPKSTTLSLYLILKTLSYVISSVIYDYHILEATSIPICVLEQNVSGLSKEERNPKHNTGDDPNQ